MDTEKIIEDILNPSAEQKRFKMWNWLNYHLEILQNFNEVGFCLLIGRENAEEYNWLITLTILFWTIEYSWNGRTKQIGGQQ